MQEQNQITEEKQEEQENIEDILSSIKDVISGNKEPDDVLELTDNVHPAGSSDFTDISNFSTEDETEDQPVTQIVSFGEENLPQSQPQEEALSLDNILSSEPASPSTTPEPSKSSLLDAKVLNETKEALSSMLKSVEKHHDSPHFRSGTTIEELVIELLKPELKAWLNDNLPSIVKSVVEKEVRKIMPQD